MAFNFQERSSTIPFVKGIWSTHSSDVASFISRASIYTEIVITRQYGHTYMTVHGAESHATIAPVPQGAEFLGITLEPGAYLAHFPAKKLLDAEINLPSTAFEGFWLGSTTWQFPTFGNADTFIQRLIKNNLLHDEPLIRAVLDGESVNFSARSIQRRFLYTTGLSRSKIAQINRAHHAHELLTSGISILDTVFEAGYYDQPHLTRSLKRFTGQTPAQISQVMSAE